MKYFFFVIALFLHLSTTLAQTNDAVFLEVNILKLKNAKNYTLKVAELMPEEKYNYKPSSEEMDFGKQLLHISENLCWLSSAYLSTNKNILTEPDKNKTTKKEILTVVAKAYDFAINVLQNFDIKTCTDTVKFFAGPMNKLQIINLLHDHQTHHRAQLLVYLRLNGIVPPAYVGW